jgi:hypothetical protein
MSGFDVLGDLRQIMVGAETRRAIWLWVVVIRPVCLGKL